jgi:heat shock protein HtpX
MLNNFKTVLLLGGMTGLLLWAGQAFGGTAGMQVAFLLAAAMNFASWFFSDKIALAMHRAQPLQEGDSPGLFALVRELTNNAGMPMPRLYLIPEVQPNAFATGRDPRHAAVAVTEGLLQAMEYEELKGVLAHELAHVKHRDILISSIAATLAGAITMIARIFGWALMFGGGRDEEGGGAGGLLFIILAPIAAVLIQFAVSRSREYSADQGGARIAGNPYGLASALRKLSSYSQQVPMRSAQATTAHMMIANPFAGRGAMMLFSTHPPMQERIRRLENMS